MLFENNYNPVKLQALSQIPHLTLLGLKMPFFKSRKAASWAATSLNLNLSLWQTQSEIPIYRISIKCVATGYISFKQLTFRLCSIILWVFLMFFSLHILFYMETLINKLYHVLHEISPVMFPECWMAEPSLFSCVVTLYSSPTFKVYFLLV